jgi:hypothetical protein
VKAAFNIQLHGFPPANREAKIELVNEATGQRVERAPFLDGSLLVRDLDPGIWNVKVQHPNLVSPIVSRKIRLFPQITPTFVPIPIVPDLFRDTPIRDIPDVDLGPVQQAATTVRTQLQPLGTKAGGEVIRASDWNALVAAVSDLAGAVLELTNLVSPRGHDHPEIAEKIDEVQGNIRRFSESFGRSLLELRREIEAETLRKTLGEVLDLGGAADDMRTRLFERAKELEFATQVETPVFTAKTSALGAVLLNDINALAQARGAEADSFLATPVVKELSDIAGQYARTGTQTRPEAELLTYQRTSSAISGSKFGRTIMGGRLL